MSKPRPVLGGLALAVTLVLNACGTDDTAPSTEQTASRSPQSSAPTSTAPHSPTALASAQLQKYLAVRDRAYQQRDIDFKTLNPVATGNEFLELQKSVVDQRKANVTESGRYVHRLSAPRDRGASMLITDCENRSGVTVRVAGRVRIPDYRAPDGKPLRNPVPVQYTLVKDKGLWKVTDSDLRWKQSC